MSQRFNRPDAAGVLHCATLNVRERQPIFARDSYARALLQTLRTACDNYPAKLVAYVAMPDHLHFIVHPQDGKLGHFLSRFKPAATKAVDALALAKNHDKMQAWLRSASAPLPAQTSFEFVADHPFLAVIEDNETGSLLFLCRVMQP